MRRTTLSRLRVCSLNRARRVRIQVVAFIGSGLCPAAPADDYESTFSTSASKACSFSQSFKGGAVPYFLEGLSPQVPSYGITWHEHAGRDVSVGLNVTVQSPCGATTKIFRKFPVEIVSPCAVEERADSEPFHGQSRPGIVRNVFSVTE